MADEHESTGASSKLPHSQPSDFPDIAQTRPEGVLRSPQTWSVTILAFVSLHLEYPAEPLHHNRAFLFGRYATPVTSDVTGMGQVDPCP